MIVQNSEAIRLRAGSGADVFRVNAFPGIAIAVPALAGGEVDDETGESSFFYADEVETASDERESVVVHVR